MNSITLASLQLLREKMKKHPNLCFVTPTLLGLEQQLQNELPVKIKSLSIKLESMQCTGSFKARGVLSQFLELSSEDCKNKRILVTMSAGNYGKAFAYISGVENMPAVVCMPESAPEDRRETIKSFGAKVLLCSSSELMDTVNNHVKNHNSLFLHSFDDIQLIKGHASAGLELVEQLPKEPDIIVVCCGGGGFLAGVSLAVRLYGWTSTKIYGVEPDAAPTMYEAIKNGKILETKVRDTIAAGLAPPFAGEICFNIVKEHVNGILLVTDDEIIRSMALLYKIGLVAEPSGAASFAALLSNKIPDCEHKDVVLILTGGNITSNALKSLLNPS
ncbi:serine racemase isoform X1 [Hydra vulgaris]|uniref:serine racemase isoform X1 n=1 Tax=Hydra vulgaris TaxID=6087 RepID=UPI000640D88E|nr:probable serine racemase [Hydra vulgaris]